MQYLRVNGQPAEVDNDVIKISKWCQIRMHKMVHGPLESLKRVTLNFEASQERTTGWAGDSILIVIVTFDVSTKVVQA